MRKAYEEGLAEARSKANEYYLAAEKNVKDKAEKDMASFQKKAQKLLEKNESDILKAKESAMAEINKIAAEVAIETADKIIGVKVDTKEMEAVIDGLQKTEQKTAKAA